ncbi:fungal-specific transcription factor domain-containing protein [Trichoderma aethiopicum]
MAAHATSPPEQSLASDSVDTIGATPVHEASLEASPKRSPKQAKSARQAKRRSQGKERYSRHAYDVSSVSEGDESFRNSTASETDEEAEVIGQIRMLQDPMKRLLYIGDSSTLSYLQLIRMIVFNTTGSSAFTDDPSRHHILEPVTTTAPSSMIPYLLPNKDVLNFLVQTFFVNTNGLIDLFDRATFYQYLDACYSGPLEVNPSTLCIVYLTLAIGLVLAPPAPDSPEELMMKSVEEGGRERAEALFRAAKCLSDPHNGVEHADLWMIQAWTLMAIYMLIISKRNAAYAYCGMAVRAAYSLGLHRIRDTMVKFNNEVARRNLWRSLFVLDRFLATALGRPAAISEEDCSSDSLDSPADLLLDNSQQEEDMIRTVSLDSSVRISRSIGVMLKKVYSERKISTKLAQEIVDDCQLWAFNGHPSLAASDLLNGKAPAEMGIPILHVHLLHYHSILLLSRPFFIDLLVKTRPTISGDVEPLRRTFSRSEKFSQACVAASTHSVTLVQAAFEAKYLPRRNPFILYFLFAAALIILSNEFAGLYENEHYAVSMTSAIKIMEYCAAEDVQAQRMLYILKSFLADVEKHLKSSVSDGQSEAALPQCHIGDPEEVLQTRRQSLTARRSSYHHQHHRQQQQQQQQEPSTPIGGESSSDAMEYYPHMETDARQSTIHVPSMGPLVMRAMAPTTSPTLSTRANAPRSLYRRTDLSLSKPDEQQEYEDMSTHHSNSSPADFQSTSMDSEETKVYSHGFNSPTMMSHAEQQSAFQAQHHGGGGGGFGGYSAAPGGRDGERAHFGGHYLYVDEK